MTRQEKIQLIKNLSAGKVTIGNLPRERKETSFERVDKNQYRCKQDGNLYSLSEIDELDRPYRELKGNSLYFDWEETKQYEDRKVVQIGTPFHVRINVVALETDEPSTIILPAITKSMLTGIHE